MTDTGGTVRECPTCRQPLPAEFRFCGHCGAKIEADEPRAAVRKTISVIFCDLKGSTTLGETLDSEALREVIARYFERVRAVIEAHGGAIEKFIGDAVMAVFGIPHQREDDAIRAVRCALEMKRSLAELNRELASGWGVTLSNRTGVNTGEIVISDASRGERLLGDAVNVAARLEQAAPAEEILIGPATYELVRTAVEVEELEPLELKGKAERVPTYRVISAIGTTEPGAGPAFVGRDAELEVLEQSLEKARRQSACRAVSVIGDPGVGKSTLTGELAKRRSDARVMRGRCLSYGRGITFWPLLEMVMDAAGISDEDPPDRARAKLLVLVDGDSQIAERVSSAIGIADAEFPMEEIFWGVRKLLEHFAAEAPLVTIFEDTHWAEPTLLDLIEHLIESADGGMLVICEARPELLVMSPEFGKKRETELISLEPLADADAGVLIRELLDGEIVADVEQRIIEAAAGNPLFVSQLVSMLIDDGAIQPRDGSWVPTGNLADLELPASLQALLSSRLDQLHHEEQAVIQPASVMGTIFPDAALEEIVDPQLQPQVALRLSSLAARQLIEDEPDYVLAGDSHRFVHVQIREAAYRRLLKRERAVLHESFANWGERVASERRRESEFQEIVGYHLEQAHRYLAELGPLDQHGRELGRRAAQRLVPAGRRAFARGDVPAAANLLRRSAEILPRDDPVRLEFLPLLGEVLIDAGEFTDAESFLDEAIERAHELGDESLGARARLTRLSLESQSGDASVWAKQVEDEVHAAIPVFEKRADHESLAMAWRQLAWAHGTQCRYGKAAEAAGRAIEESRISGDARQRRRAASQYAVAAVHGPMPVAEAIERCESIIAEASGDRRTEGLVSSLLARLEAMRGDFDRARILYLKARLDLEEMGRSVIASSTSLDSCGVEMLAGDPAAAERELRRDYAALEAMGERYLLSTLAGELARAVVEQGRDAEALELSRKAEELATGDDIATQALWRLSRARILARRGERESATAFARAAVELLADGDAALTLGEGLLEAAEALELSGETAEAEASLRQALKLLESKGNLVCASAARERLAVLAGRPGGERPRPDSQREPLA